MQTCECGGRFEELADLEGMYCNRCSKHIEGVVSLKEEDKALRHMYSEDRAKVVRGVPMSYIRIGSETKGRIEISIPCYATSSEARAIIDKHLDYLKYTSNGIEERELDIFTTRK